MTSLATSAAPGTTGPAARLDEICDELAELCGQQNAIAGRICALLAEVEEAQLLGGTGIKSLVHFATWRLGASPGRAKNLAGIARRRDELPRTVRLLEEGRLSEDQVATIARRAPAGTDEHYSTLAESATVGQLRTALRMAPRPEPEPEAPTPPPRPERRVAMFWDDDDQWHLDVTLPAVEGSVAEAAVRSHLDALVAEWKRAHPEDERTETTPPFPRLADAFVRMTEHSLDAEAAARPHGHRSTVVVHVDADTMHAGLHLGPVLTDAERRYLGCDARFEVWFERAGVPIGCGRTSREIPRRLRRALERRDRSCRVPGCGSTSGLHAHHIVHWEDGGPTELENLALVCPFHHRMHHVGVLTIAGDADSLTVRDRFGRCLVAGGLARPPTAPPPAVEPYDNPTGERFDTRFYDPPMLS